MATTRAPLLRSSWVIERTRALSPPYWPTHDALVLDGRGDAVESLELPDRRHSRPAAGSRADDRQRLRRARAADAVDVESAIALEVLQRPGSERSEDAVDPSAVEAELAEHRLQRADVVATKVGSEQLQRADPSRHDASTSASQVTSSHVPWSCKPRSRWNACTAVTVAASNDPGSAPTGANPAPPRRRWRSRIASPCCPGISERKPEIRRAPAAAGSCLVLR